MYEGKLEMTHEFTVATMPCPILDNEGTGDKIAKPLASRNRSRIGTVSRIASKDGTRNHSSRRRKQRSSTKAVLLSILASTPLAMADCVSLQGSSQCPAFTSSSIDNTLTGLLYVSHLLLVSINTNHKLQSIPILCF